MFVLASFSQVWGQTYEHVSPHNLSTLENCRCAANASKLIEKCFLDLRNIFLNQKNIRRLQENLS